MIAIAVGMVMLTVALVMMWEKTTSRVTRWDLLVYALAFTGGYLLVEEDVWTVVYRIALCVIWAIFICWLLRRECFRRRSSP